MEYIVKKPQSQVEFESYYNLRFEVLRKSWGQAKGSEKDQEEDIAEHAMIWDDKLGAIAVGRLQKIDSSTGQIRFMAVHPDFQSKGLGKKVLNFIEEKAREMKIEKIILQARENAIPFYNANGYLLVGKSHLLFGSIQHYKMIKNLS